MTPTLTPLTTGIYFDNTRGWHISALVVKLAAERGFDYPEARDRDYQQALKIAREEGAEALEAFCAERDLEMLAWLEQDAQAYIDDHLVPEGCWAGYSEDFGDWGVWELEEDA